MPWSTTIQLQPLQAEASDRLLAGLLGTRVPDALKERVASMSEGNPLFAEEPVELPEGTLVIADEAKILAVAGVIGCEESKTTESTITQQAVRASSCRAISAPANVSLETMATAAVVARATTSSNVAASSPAARTVGEPETSPLS